jgi:hypothetical protein
MDPQRFDRDTPIGQQALGLDALALMRAFFKITNADDRRKVIELAAALVPGASPPIAPARRSQKYANSTAALAIPLTQFIHQMLEAG